MTIQTRKKVGLSAGAAIQSRLYVDCHYTGVTREYFTNKSGLLNSANKARSEWPRLGNQIFNDT